MKILNLYSNLLLQHPLKTKMATASLIFSSADIICQKWIEQKSELNKKRTLINTIVGGLVQAPILHCWINVLYRGVNIYLPRYGLLINASERKKAIVSVLLDSVFFAPFIQTAYYMTSNFLSNLNLESGIKAIKEKLPQSMMNAMKVWPASNFICFQYIPLQYRVLWSNTVGMGWQIYMSSHNHHIQIQNIEKHQQNETQTSNQSNNSQQIKPNLSL